MQWVNPSSLAPKLQAHTSAAPVTTDAVVEERVRGGTNARDAVQQAAEEQLSPRAAGRDAQHIMPMVPNATPTGAVHPSQHLTHRAACLPPAQAARSLDLESRQTNGARPQHLPLTQRPHQHATPLTRAASHADLNLGYPRNLHELYRVERELGHGAFGVVTAVTHLDSDKAFACKTIPKRPTPELDERKQAAHIAGVQREIAAMKALRSCLNVARLEAVFEDDECVHIVQELCTGGELVHALGQRHYSERTVRRQRRLLQCALRPS